MKVSAAQLRAARGFLGWSQQELADAANIGRATIADYESGRRAPYAPIVENLKQTFEAHGIEFIHGAHPGIRLRT